MVIVAGHLIVDPSHREDYLAGCAAGVEQAGPDPAPSGKYLRSPTMPLPASTVARSTRRTGECGSAT